MVKVDIPAALLLQAHRQGRALIPTERSLADSMITQSDIDAASTLWDEIGDASWLSEVNRAV